MIRIIFRCCCLFGLVLVVGMADLHAQKPPYDVFPPAEPPYYRVRYEASTNKGELIYPVNYTIWIPTNVKTLRGVIVHQHGCGEGSCKSGLTGAYDLHWQALAKKHDCALLAPSYEQPEKADCQMWCDPRNGSGAAFQKCLVDLGAKSGHPELAKAPWALWGHSGGGHWAGGMVMLHPEQVAAAWLRSGVPLLKENPKGGSIKAHTLPDAALKVPVMCNLGTKEGVTVKGDRFAGVWPANEAFFKEIRGKHGLIGVAIDPLTAHECGNQRYLAIPWLDACLSARLPKTAGEPLQAMRGDKVWWGLILDGIAAREVKGQGDVRGEKAWLPNEAIAKAWMEYVKDTKVTDTTPPPAPTNVRVQGNKLTWEAEADLESGLASFVVERDGQVLANLPEQGKNPFGRPIFQNLQYSDTPSQPLVPMQFTDTKAESGKTHSYRVVAVNTVGLKSKASAEATLKADPLAAVKSKVELEALIAATSDASQSKALKAHSAEILAAVTRRPHVQFVADTVEKSKGTCEKSNSTPDPLRQAFGGPSALFDSLKSVNLGSTELGIKAKRDVDPFDQDFYVRLSQIDNLEELVILHTTAQNAWLAPLAKLSALKTLRIINQSKLNDEGLAHLAGLKQLESFGYIGTAMTGEPFKDFQGWNNLKRASFRGSRMSDGGLAALCERFPNLESLVLAHGHFSDEAVAGVARLKKLTGLEIGSPKATPKCLQHLLGLPLEYLQLGDGLDASVGIAIIKDIKTLKRLTLTNCSATTDDDLKRVAGMKHLEHLELGNITIPEGRLAMLKEFAFLKSMRILKAKMPFNAEEQAMIKAVLPAVAIKFE